MDDEEFVLPIEDFIDLHPFRPRDVRAVVESYLEEAVRHGFAEVRLIHGRGIGVQRDAVRAVLEKNGRVVEFHDAPAERGGWGATVARLDLSAHDD
jgi:dsDNA-specific endonuclease/ATPase MutS2